MIRRTGWAAALGLVCIATAQAAAGASYERVLLGSIDGMDAVDLATHVAAHPQGALASLSRTGITYPNAVTTNPSDSFPGFLA